MFKGLPHFPESKKCLKISYCQPANPLHLFFGPPSTARVFRPNRDGGRCPLLTRERSHSVVILAGRRPFPRLGIYQTIPFFFFTCGPPCFYNHCGKRALLFNFPPPSIYTGLASPPPLLRSSTKMIILLPPADCFCFFFFPFSPEKKGPVNTRDLVPWTGGFFPFHQRRRPFLFPALCCHSFPPPFFDLTNGSWTPLLCRPRAVFFFSDLEERRFLCLTHRDALYFLQRGTFSFFMGSIRLP